VTTGDNRIIEQIIKQLDKQVRVISVMDLTALDHIERELALIHVKVGCDERRQVMDLVDMFPARVIDTSESALTIEATGDRAKVNALIGLLAPFGIQEMVRAGTLAIPRLPAAKVRNDLIQAFATI
jgi:acetolactate synthase-1/3 small subunit